MIQDLHSHTYYSFCGKDSPEAVAEGAIAGGIELLGFTDHNYGIGFQRVDIFYMDPKNFEGKDYGRCLVRYFDHINLIREKYADRIRILRGIELCTLSGVNLVLPENSDISFFDYCLIENLDCENSVTGGDLFSYAKKLNCRAGVAHTDLFAHAERLGVKPLDYFKRMADEDIFWEMNVSYDPTHNYHQHQYVLDFFADPEKQEIVRKSGVKVSVGFDGHRIEDYLPDRVKSYCRSLEEMEIPMPFEKDFK